MHEMESELREQIEKHNPNHSALNICFYSTHEAIEYYLDIINKLENGN